MQRNETSGTSICLRLTTSSSLKVWRGQIRSRGHNPLGMDLVHLRLPYTIVCSECEDVGLGNISSRPPPFVDIKSPNEQTSSGSRMQVSVISCSCEVLSLRISEVWGGQQGVGRGDTVLLFRPWCTTSKTLAGVQWRPTFDLSAECPRCDYLGLGAFDSFAVSLWNPSFLVYVLLRRPPSSHHIPFFPPAPVLPDWRLFQR